MEGMVMVQKCFNIYSTDGATNLSPFYPYDSLISLPCGILFGKKVFVYGYVCGYAHVYGKNSVRNGCDRNMEENTGRA